jgi:hypothetical protein
VHTTYNNLPLLAKTMNDGFGQNYDVTTTTEQLQCIFSEGCGSSMFISDLPWAKEEPRGNQFVSMDRRTKS